MATRRTGMYLISNHPRARPKISFCLLSTISSLGGLVQRKTAASDGGATALDPPGAEGGLDRPDTDGAAYDDGGDSKAMRLTLMEEVLLLGLKDREVS